MNILVTGASGFIRSALVPRLAVNGHHCIPLRRGSAVGNETGPTSDPNAAPPDEVIERRERLEQVQNTANSCPKPEREVFELYFVEGFVPGEIAMVLGVSVKEAEALLAGICGCVREALLGQSAV